MMHQPPEKSPVTFSTTIRRITCLGIVGGYLNAIGFIDLGGLYPAAMTGNTTQLGLAIVKLQWGRVFLIGSTVFCFFAGGVLSSLLQRVLIHPAFELLLMIALVSLAQIVRMVVPDAMPWELPLLAFTLAMQGETVTRFAGSSLQTVVVTNTLLKFADSVVGRYVKYNDATRTSRADFVIPGTSWLAYLLGAGLGGLAGINLSYPFVPTLILLLILAMDIFAWPAHLSGEGGKGTVR
jgi:uncharacterized membrane protein YoaK (UPF0700 family)